MIFNDGWNIFQCFFLFVKQYFLEVDHFALVLDRHYGLRIYVPAKYMLFQ